MCSATGGTAAATCRVCGESWVQPGDRFAASWSSEFLGRAQSASEGVDVVALVSYDIPGHANKTAMK